MKTTKSQLRQVIKEEVENALQEQEKVEEIALLPGAGFLVNIWQPLQEVFKLLKTLGEILEQKDDVDPEIRDGAQAFVDLCSASIKVFQNLENLWADFRKDHPKVAKILIVKFAVLDIVGLSLSKFLDFALNRLNKQIRKARELPPEMLDKPEEKDDIDPADLTRVEPTKQ